MKMTWFQHPDCTTQQADELVSRYRQRNVPVERSLNRDLVTWSVSARLPEYARPPRTDRRWQNRMWRG